MDARTSSETFGRDVSLLLPMRRWRLRDWLLFGLPVLAALAIALLHMTSPPPNLSLDVYERITAGMSQREVERLVGARPGGYDCFHADHSECLKQEWGKPDQKEVWGNRYVVLEVGFDSDGRVCAKALEYHPGERPDRPDRWPWWKRLLDRRVPSDGVTRACTHF